MQQRTIAQYYALFTSSDDAAIIVFTFSCNVWSFRTSLTAVTSLSGCRQSLRLSPVAAAQTVWWSPSADFNTCKWSNPSLSNFVDSKSHNSSTDILGIFSSVAMFSWRLVCVYVADERCSSPKWSVCFCHLLISWSVARHHVLSWTFTLPNQEVPLWEWTALQCNIWTSEPHWD